MTSLAAGSTNEPTPISNRRTRIVATIGPASDAPEVIAAMAAAGMDVARLTLAHGSIDDAVAHGLDGRVAPSCTDVIPLAGADGYAALWNSRYGLARSTGLRAFMDAAGVECSQRLGDIVAGLPALDEAESVRLLGGRSC